MAQLKYWDGSAWQIAATGVVGPTGPTGPPAALAYISGTYYRTPYALVSQTATLDRLHYVPLLVPVSTSLDRLVITTASTFSGTAVVRLGLYTENAGKPDSLIVDAGTVSCTAASTAYQITINNSVGPGFFFVAAVMQTAATTSTFLGTGAGGAYNPWLTSVYSNTVSGTSGSFYETSVSGALPSTATAATQGSTGIVSWVRAT
jgi:hypothetical protein